MRRLIPTLLLVISIIALIFVLPMSISLFNSVNAEDDNDSLTAAEVLQIVARPLPEDAIEGFYLVGADISNTLLKNVDFEFADLTGANLSGTNFENGMLREATLHSAIVRSADFSFANLSGADLQDTDLTGANFFFSNLTGAIFIGADLTNVDFSSAILENATLPNGETYNSEDDLVSMFGAASNP